MQVFTEFIKDDLTEDQILPVLRQLLPVLLSILGSAESHSAPTRARTVSVFHQCVTALFMVKDQHPQATKEAVASVLPVWLEAFKVLLKVDPKQDVSNDNWDGLTTLDTIHTSFPRALTPYLQEFLTDSLVHLQALHPTFEAYYLSSSESVPRSSEDEAIELPQLICPILDFAAAATRGGKAKNWFSTENLNALIAAVISFVQMTDEDSLIDRSPAATSKAFQLAIEQVVHTSQQMREGGKKDWWKPLEATLAATGSQAEAILDCIDDEVESGREKPINVEYLLSNIVPSILTLSEQPFLQGRGFVFASQYSKLLPAELANQYLTAAVQVIEATEAGIPVKISAVKAINNFCQGGEDATLINFVPRIAKDLGPFLFATSDDTLSLVLETLSVVLEVEKDPIFLSILTDILATLAGSPTNGIYEAVVKQALPPLSSAIASSKPTESWVSGSAIELITSLVQGSPESGVGEGFFAMLAPNLFEALGETDDRDVLQNGIACLTIIVRKDCNQLLTWNDQSGRSGLDYVLNIIAKTLDSQDESGGLVIGDLIIHLLRRAGESVLPVLPQLLQAMVGRMLTAKTATFLQSLVVPFAFLINNQRDTVLTLLEGTNVNGRSGLDILIQTWCENAETFQGFWPSRISTMGLIQLFISERPSLQNLIVKGDIIVNKSNKDVIMTRSRTRTTPTEFTSIPFPVKAVKLLLHDVRSGGESATIAHGGGDTYDIDSDDGDEDWTEEEKQNQGFKEDEFAFLSDMIGPKGMAFDNDDVLDDSDDEDLKNDPISQMDMQQHLVSFFKECASRNTNNFSALVGQLSVEETLVIRQVVGA
ncbi:hypothetical protein H0H81_002226 [Sphagnurus paluster]|uniref:Importin-9 n=1 Tax=Sphagnurus paluster TaxID=117069 RepID=A0A9P7K6L2_9AGAR|nr:hypothetical protein H0H81_002226 [Sphagnurus paluster]